MGNATNDEKTGLSLSQGLMQTMPIKMPDYDKMLADLENMTKEERIKAARNYMQCRLRQWGMNGYNIR